jgi:hypothetical protein
MSNFELPQSPRPTHKTRGIDLIAWSKLFTIEEMMLIDKLSSNIEGDLSFLPSGEVNIDDSTVEKLGIEGTYRDFLRSCFKRFAECNTTGINVDDPLVMPSLYCFELLGLIAAGRKEVIICGVPL